MGREIACIGMIVGLLSAVPFPACGQEPQSFHVSQAIVRMPQVKTYLDITDGNDQAVPDLGAARLTASLGGRSLNAAGPSVSFEKSGEGVGYVFAIDTSGSILPKHLEQIKIAMANWIAEMGPMDRVALLSFSDKVDVISDFTADKNRVKDGLSRLQQGGDRTLLHLALSEALDLGTRHDQDLPDRRAVLVLSDGKDEGSGLAVEDVLLKAQTLHVPIYAIGYSNLPGKERRQYLDVLHRFALLSGGAYSESGEGDLAPSFVSVKKAIARVFIATFQCPDYPSDGHNYRLEVQLNAGTRSFSDGYELPVFSAQVRGPGGGPVSPAARGQRRKLMWVAGAGVGALLVLAGLFVFRRKRQRRKETDAVSPMPVQPVPWPPSAPIDAGAGATAIPELSQPPASSSVVRFQFTTLRGSRRGEKQEVEMRIPSRNGTATPVIHMGRLVIGRLPGCDLTLTGDDAVSGQHCALLWDKGRLIVQDLKSSNGTAVNGVPVRGDQPLESGDVIAVGHNEYRMMVLPEQL
jgi:VWFA-related protein